MSDKMKKVEIGGMNEDQQKIKDKFIEVSKLGLTDKADYHAYEEVYPYLLDKFLGRKCNILEVGVAKGGGLKILSELFPESNIYGIDWNLSQMQVDIDSLPNVQVFSGDQRDPALMEKLPELDFVTEDASHQFNDSITTFELLKEKLKYGAVYVIEDVYPQFVNSYEVDGRFDIYDATKIKGRGDDVLAVYNNTNE
tara:strand:+ start:89 stop:676 length:588 start_codon:yes stop_codon:yes gene_type:complete